MVPFCSAAVGNFYSALDNRAPREPVEPHMRHLTVREGCSPVEYWRPCISCTRLPEASIGLDGYQPG